MSHGWEHYLLKAAFLSIGIGAVGMAVLIWLLVVLLARQVFCRPGTLGAGEFFEKPAVRLSVRDQISLSLNDVLAALVRVKVKIARADRLERFNRRTTQTTGVEQLDGLDPRSEILTMRDGSELTINAQMRRDGGSAYANACARAVSRQMVDV